MDHLSVARPAVVLLAVGAMMVIGSPAQALSWTTVDSPNEVPGNNYLSGADASDASNVWAVGAFVAPRGAGGHAVALRYDGAAWRTMPRTGLPGHESLSAVDAVSVSDVWAVGTETVGLAYNTLAAHWNGTAWTREATPNGNPGGFNNLSGVAAAAGSVWAVGTYVDPNSASNRRKLIFQRTGGTWRAVAAPTVATYETLADIDATGSTDAWAVGAATGNPQRGPLAPLVVRWNGTGWQSTTLPAPGSTALAGVDARTTGDVWAVGYSYVDYARQPYVAHFDGTSWRRVATPTLSGGGELAAVVALSSSTVVAVGRSNGAPLVLRWNGTSWTQETTPGASAPYLTGATPAGAGKVWAVGYRFELNAYSNRTLAMLGS